MRGLSDEMLATLAQNRELGAADELMRRYDRMATGEASQFFLPGADVEDVQQEARIGLLRAVMEFQPDRGLRFAGFAHLAIRRQLITALKAARRAKHRPLTDSVRSGVNAEDERVDILDLLEAPNTDVVERLADRELIRQLGRGLRVKLSVLEARCLILWANGASYAQIEEIVGASSWKAVDRAITRARWKLAGEGPPAARWKYGREPSRRVYECAGCGFETVRVTDRGFERKGAGRPPLCNVCTTRKAAA